MLFDLRSRGRRRTVQVIYAFLALIMLGGLLLVGVGTGSGGGILNAFTNNGSGGGSSGAVKSAFEKQALKLTKEQPNNPAAWAKLIQAEYSDYTSQTKSGPAKQALTDLTNSYTHYLTLTKTPDPDTALLASRAYALLQNYKAASAAKEIFANANPTSANAFECWAMAATAAKQTRIAQLATAKAISLVPKAQQFETTQQLKQLSANAAAAAAQC
jgi:hypothetical protein